jgi:hypothetical protein
MSCTPNNGTTGGASAFDNRIRFSTSAIDFTNDVGLTQQQHDTYPSPNTQARYDWMRMYLIGLLSNQSSCDQPSQYRPGTMWYQMDCPNTGNGYYKAYDCLTDTFTDLSDYIKAFDSIDGNVNLTSFINSTRISLGAITNATGALNVEIILYGNVTSVATNEIIVPAEMQSMLGSDYVPFVYFQNDAAKTSAVPFPGMTLIPADEVVLSPAYDKVTLLNIFLTNGDKYMVSFRRIAADLIFSRVQ